MGGPVRRVVLREAPCAIRVELGDRAAAGAVLTLFVVPLLAAGARGARPRVTARGFWGTASTMTSSPPPQCGTGRVVENEALTPTVRHLSVALDREISFRAGQCIQLIIAAPRVLRTFSICSPPSQRRQFELCVDISPGGRGSLYVAGLRVGDRVPFRGPFGVFTVDDVRRPLEFVATGAGIAPMRSMIRDLLERNVRTPLQLLFGGRSEKHLLYHEEFLRLAGDTDTFRYVPTLSRPSRAWMGTRGRVTEVLGRRTDLSGRAFYICGSPEMVDDVRKVLGGKGIPEDGIHFEKFTPAPERPGRQSGVTG